MSPRKLIRLLLLVSAVISGIALAARAWLGPYQFLLSVRSPINAESIFAAAFVLLILTAERGIITKQQDIATRDSEPADRREDLLHLGLLMAFLAAALWPSALVGFLADDYAHILAASKADLATVAHWFTVPASDNLFFRPVAMASYWIDAQWAGFSPIRWHVAALVFHAINAGLLFTLARRLGLGLNWALFAAALFGIHASRPEAVTWVAARFDLVATLFVLTALLLFLAYLDTPRPALLALLLASTLCGVLSKESAFALPLLLVALAWYRQDGGPAARRAILATSGLASVVFLDRWIVLGGIGGYVDQTGHALASTFNPTLILKALTLRLWAVLIFPINWTDLLGLPLKILIGCTIVALAILAFRAHPDRLTVLGLMYTLIAALPVVHLLLIGPDLEKSRVVYLASAGFAIFLASAARLAPPRIAFAAVLVTLAFQLAALRHNLATWDRVSHIHQQACDTLSYGIARNTEAAAIGMPNTMDGVYMLRTGLPECLEIRHSIPAKNLHMVSDAAALPDPNMRAYTWDPATARIILLRR